MHMLIYNLISINSVWHYKHLVFTYYVYILINIFIERGQAHDMALIYEYTYLLLCMLHIFQEEVQQMSLHERWKVLGICFQLHTQQQTYSMSYDQGQWGSSQAKHVALTGWCDLNPFRTWQVLYSSCVHHRDMMITLRQNNIAMENGPGLKMCFLLKLEIFHCYVSLPEGIPWSAPRAPMIPVATFRRFFFLKPLGFG